MKHHLTFFVALLLAPPVTLHAADAPRKPNFLIILADDLGYADLGCQGSKEAMTPQIDSLAANGVRCTAGYVTAPQCCPSRAGLITGRYQNRFGFEANWPAALSRKAGLPTSERTVADQLRAAGYVTGLIGKWHLGDAEAMRPYNRGFDETLWHANGGVLFPDIEYGQNTSRNDPCRGVKGDLLEGGIRVPFLVQWKGRLPAGRTFDQPVISLDILPTVLAASGVEPLPGAKLDGTNLLPFLAGEKQDSPHDTLCWRFRFPPAQPARHRWAIRQGDWKLVKNDTAALALYHLADDLGETKNLAAEQPERVRAMQAAWKQWDAENREPLWQEAPSLPSHQAKVEVFPTEIRVPCTGNDPQLILSEIPAGTGPFTLELKVKSTSASPGELFWATTDAPQFVPGQSVPFQLLHDGQAWREYTVELPATAQPLRHLRFDPGNAPASSVSLDWCSGTQRPPRGPG